MTAPVGPFVTHFRFAKRPPEHAHKSRFVTVHRKTFRAAENVLSWFVVHVEAKWITNGQGIVYSWQAFGDPSPSCDAEIEPGEVQS